MHGFRALVINHLPGILWFGLLSGQFCYTLLHGRAHCVYHPVLTNLHYLQLLHLHSCGNIVGLAGKIEYKDNGPVGRQQFRCGVGADTLYENIFECKFAFSSQVKQFKIKFFYLPQISPLPEIKRFKRNKIETKINPNSVWLTVDEGLRRVRENPGFVYVFEAFSGYGLVEKSYTAQEICDLNEVLFRPEQALYTHLHRNSSYIEIVKLK